MKHLIFDEIDRIKLDKEYWIDIKRRMSYGDNQKLMKAYMRLQTQLKEQTTDMELDVETGNIMLLLINVQGWNLTGQDGKVVPVNEEMIKRLDPQIADKIIDEINKRNPAPKV